MLRRRGWSGLAARIRASALNFMAADRDVPDVVRQRALAREQDRAQQCGVVLAHSFSHGVPCGQSRAPGADTGRSSKEFEVLELLEHVEVAEHRPERRVDERETLA